MNEVGLFVGNERYVAEPYEIRSSSGKLKIGLICQMNPLLGMYLNQIIRKEINIIYLQNPALF